MTDEHEVNTGIPPLRAPTTSKFSPSSEKPANVVALLFALVGWYRFDGQGDMRQSLKNCRGKETLRS